MASTIAECSLSDLYRVFTDCHKFSTRRTDSSEKEIFLIFFSIERYWFVILKSQLCRKFALKIEDSQNDSVSFTKKIRSLKLSLQTFRNQL